MASGNRHVLVKGTGPTTEEGCSGPVSRILCRLARRRLAQRDGSRAAIIPLGPRSLAASSNLPGGFGRAVLERLPIWSCSVRGFACHVRYRPRGALLPHLFTLTPSARPCGLEPAGGIFSVPLSVGLPRPGVTRRTALRSSDFPRQPCGPAIACSPAARDHSEPSAAALDARLRTARASTRRHRPAPLAVLLLDDLVLLELLVEVAARRVEHLGGPRDVPAVLAQLLDQERALRPTSLNSRSVRAWAAARRAGAALDGASAAAAARRGSTPRRRGSSARPAAAAGAGRGRRDPPTRRISRTSCASTASPRDMISSRSTVFRSSRMLPRQRCCCSTSSASGEKRRGLKLFSRRTARRSACTSSGMSSGRSRSGGTWIGITLRRK